CERSEAIHVPGLHGLPRYARSDEGSVQGPCAVSGRVRGARNDETNAVIVTEWKAYRSPNWTALKAAMKEPVVFDGRNLYEPQEMKENGMAYVAIGRGTHV
ncbi:UDP binding domain-containing protein, partial [Rhodoferax sp.]|uniref:UDP binding domain-containing protein n=1 Tax=Rhodoferax sp. TaxID=50421 RepID=UPI003BB54621